MKATVAGTATGVLLPNGVADNFTASANVNGAAFTGSVNRRVKTVVVRTVEPGAGVTVIRSGGVRSTTTVTAWLSVATLFSVAVATSVCSPSKKVEVSQNAR